jgi:hypothetical protein
LTDLRVAKSESDGAQENSHGKAMAVWRFSLLARVVQPPQQLVQVWQGEQPQALQTGTCTWIFFGTILQTWTGTVLVTLTGTQTVYFWICFFGTVWHTVSVYVSVFCRGTQTV